VINHSFMIIKISWPQGRYDQGVSCGTRQHPNPILGPTAPPVVGWYARYLRTQARAAQVRQANAVAHTSIQPFKVTMIEQVRDIGVGRAAG
jgi:hypothetical protein